MMKKLFYYLSVIISLTIVFIACETTETFDPQSKDAMYKASADKVKICHLTGNGNWITINISQNALPVHLAHGDELYFPYPGTYTWNFHWGGGIHPHTMIITEVFDGTFSGHGYKNANNGFTWDIVDGAYDDYGNISFTIDYTGFDSRYFLNCTGSFECGSGASGNVSGSHTGSWDASFLMDI